MIFHVFYLFLAICYGVSAEQSHLHKKGDGDDDPDTMAGGDDDGDDPDTAAAGDDGDDDVDAESFLQLHDGDLDLTPEQIESMSSESLLELHDRLQEHVDNTQVLHAVLSSFTELADDTDGEDGEDAHFDKWYSSVMSKLQGLAKHTDQVSLMEKVAGASTWAMKHVVGNTTDASMDKEDGAFPSDDSLLESKDGAAQVAKMEKHYEGDFAKAFSGALNEAMANETKEARRHTGTDSLLETDDKKGAKYNNIPDPFAKLKAQEDEVGREMNQVFNPDSLAASFADTASVAVGADGKTENLNLRTGK